MKRSTRPSAVLLSTALATAGLAIVLPSAASAATLGSVVVNPLTGTDSTLFSGSVTAACPAGTGDSYFSIDGPDLPADSAILGTGSPSGVGSFTFNGASIANLKSTNSGSFSQSAPYFVRFNCVRATDGAVTDTYTTQLNYTAGGGGSYAVVVPARATSTSLSANPAGPFEAGTPTTLTADVTPTSGADNPVGSVTFYDGSTSLGTVSTLSSTGVATLSNVVLAQGSRSLTAVYAPGSTAFTGSTSPAVVVQVNPAAARPTTTTFSAAPTTGPAYSSVSLTCDADATTGQPNGSVTFLDGSSPIGSGTVTSGAPVTITTSSLGAGSHVLSCTFTGTAPYTNSASNSVTASYDNVGATPDDQTVSVSIPQGVLTISTPYTPAAPLSLGTAVLDPASSTYSASAQFGTPDRATADPDGSGPLTGESGYITVTDTRAGNLGWSASLISGAFSNGAGSSFPGKHAGLTNVTAVQVPGNALLKTDVVTASTTPFAPGLDAPRQFASYPANKGTGSAWLTGLFGIDKVPTSVAPGLYTATVTFTAL